MLLFPRNPSAQQQTSSHGIFHDVFRALVPQPHERIPISKHHIPYLLFPVIPLIYMGYLARRPNTFTLRVLLLPLVVAVTVGTYFRFMWTEPRYNVYNWGQGKSFVINITPFVLCGVALNQIHQVYSRGV